MKDLQGQGDNDFIDQKVVEVTQTKKIIYEYI